MGGAVFITDHDTCISREIDHYMWPRILCHGNASDNLVSSNFSEVCFIRSLCVCVCVCVFFSCNFVNCS
jgi:hypothetical protein